MNVTGPSFSAQTYRWLGGPSHVNSSQKGTLHYHVVEARIHGRIFYGTGLTVRAAKEEAETKAELFTTTKGVFLEFLTGHPPCPLEPYKDALPSKDQVCKPYVYVSGARFRAILGVPPTDSENEYPPSLDPRVTATRDYFSGLPDERLIAIGAILNPSMEFWDARGLGHSAYEILKDMLKECHPPLGYARETIAPKNGSPELFRWKLRFLNCLVEETERTDDRARELVSRSSLLWIRRQILDLIIKRTGTTSIEPLMLHPGVSELISQVVHQKLGELKKFIESQVRFRQVVFSDSFASVVLQEQHNFRVVALASGNGTILPKATQDVVNRDSVGFLIKDCHAVVLVLRALKLFFYDQLDLFLDTSKSSHSVFTRGQHGSIVLRAGYSCHLYVSHKPCGHPDILNLNSKSNASPFHLYEKCGVDQEVCRVTEGSSNQFIRIMSCCDKLQKRCFLGVQGALLSQLIIPVYLGLVVVGSNNGSADGKFLLHRELEDQYLNKPNAHGQGPPFGYGAVSPALVKAMHQGDSTESISNKKSLCYYADRASGRVLLEMLDPDTGRQLNRGSELGPFSLLCKRSLFLRFRSLQDKLMLNPEASPPTCTINPRFRGSYLENKHSSVDYVAHKETFVKLLEKAQQTWVRKPPLVEKFSCTLEALPKDAAYLLNSI